MTPEQEKKFDEWVEKNPELEAMVACKSAWQACLDTNGIGKEVKPSLDDLCKSFESLAYSITKASDKLTEAIERGCEKAEKEKAQVQWIPKEGEAVFVVYFNDFYVVGRVDRINSVDKIYIRKIDGNLLVTSHVWIKPFDVSKIGKKWEEI